MDFLLFSAHLQISSPQTKICLQTLDYFEDLWLVSTHVFDEYMQNVDPLDILDLPDMKEHNLRKRNAPHLQHLLEKHGIPALSIAHIGIKAGSHASLSSLELQLSVPDINTEEGEALSQEPILSSKRRRSSIPLPAPIVREKLTCCEMTKNWLCCYLCRNRGLVVARAVRKYQLEGEFLEERAHEYERKASQEEGESFIFK